MVRIGTWIEARPSLHIPGLIDSRTDECHITLAYLGDVDPEKVAEALNSDAMYTNIPYEPILSEAHGTARWMNADGDHVDVILVSPPIPKIGNHTIYTERERIMQRLASADIVVDDLYPFVPHITMPGGWPADPKKMLWTIKARTMFAIDRIYVSYTERDGAGVKATKHIEVERITMKG